MLEVFAAFARAVSDLTRGGLWFHALWPSLVSISLWGLIGVLGWPAGTAWLGGVLPTLPWSGWQWLTDWAAGFLYLCALAPLAYFTTVLLIGAVALPRMMTVVAARHYADVLPHGSMTSAIWGGIVNTLKASLIYVGGWLLSLPLLLIPGALLVLPILWTAWMNQRSFRFDALAEHATAAEMTILFRRRAGNLRLAGIATALLTYVPIVNLIAPALAALVFVHLCLGALRRLRQEEGITL
ncbi:MAG: hypothetical protein EG825_06175 [Rhodocyclaceae bacterium]|nr:hypothetical protein [Rhodocyclaceae bacterium]